MARFSRRHVRHHHRSSPRLSPSSWERLEGRTLLANAVAGVGTGLIANYFSDQELQNLAHARVDATVDFDWGQFSPAAGVPADNFSVRWSGKVQAQFDETYTFYTQSDEGVALWVNGQQLIDNFTDHTFGENAGTITLKAGELYDIRIDYYDNQFDAAMKLLWASPSTPKQIIPRTQLYADAGWTSGAWLNTGIGNSGGSVSSFGKTYTITGGGGTSGDSDRFHYLYQTLNGNGVLIAQVAATQGTGGGAGAGVMIRDSLAGNAAYASVVVDANGSGAFVTREVSNGPVTTSVPSGGGTSGKYWVKLVRDGDFFRGYTSASGTDGSWKYFGATNIPMGRTVYAGAFSTSGQAGGLNNAQFKNISLVANVPLGAGLDQVRDWSAGHVFVDAARSARTPQGPNLGPAVAFDEQGWPMADFMTIFVSGFAGTSHLYNGTYKGSFTGQADLNHWITPGGQILNKSYNASTNTTTFDLVVNASPTQDNWYVGMNFLNTRRTPQSALGSGITNLKLIRPGYDPSTIQTFRTEYLDHLNQFGVLRFMDWTATNNNKVVNWSERTKLTDARQSSNKGVAWEHVVELANLLDKDLWVNIPNNANDDYVAQLAQLLKDTLEPDRIVYVEYSNEVWNGIFDQSSENTAAAVAEVEAGGSPLAADGSTNQFYWGWRRVAKRIKEISDTFASVWGQSAINARVRPVLAGQHANPLVVQQGIEFLERTYGAPGKYLYGIATAPYFAFSSSFDSVPRTADELLTALQGSVNSLTNRYWQHDTLARRYGLAHVAYEGGSHIDGPNNLASKRQAQLDPRMKDIVTSYLNGWYAQGGGLFEWFVAGPTVWNDKGMWGLTNAIDNYTAPKALGTIEVASAARKGLTFGFAVPATFDARAVAGATLPYANGSLKDPGAGASFDYFVRAPRSGRYRITLSAATAGSNEQLRLVVNGSAVRTVTLRNTGSTSAFQNTVVGTFDLVEGVNLLHLTSVKETTWNIETVTVEPAPAANGVPAVAQAAAASGQSADQKTINLSVLGADNGGESNLVYSWEAIDEQPLSVTFSSNGSNAAKNTTATFTRSGTYRMRVTMSNGLASTTSTVNVTVNPIVSGITVTPTGTVIANGETRQLKAVAQDQFGINLLQQPQFSWSVDNGFGSVDQNGLYTAPPAGIGTATVRASSGGISGTATVITQLPRTPDNPAHLVPQIEYKYYEGSWTSVPNFDALTPAKSGLVNNVSLAPRLRNDNFAFQYTGYVFVPASGTYTFYVNSDDGSKLWVGGQQVVDNDGTHSARERSGSIILDTGWHHFKLGYFEATGGESLSLSFSGPGLASKQVIPDANVNRVNKAPVVLTPPSASPNPVEETTAQLSVVGGDESGANALTYTWSTLSAPNGAATPTFSANGTNASRNAIVTFFKAGNYTLQVSISDGNLSTTATVEVVVDQTISSITVSPATATVKQNRTQQFAATARDQFGNLVSNPTLTWSVPANGGTITSSGLYTAPAALGSYSVTASAGSVSGFANVNVVEDAAPTVAVPASASPNPTSGSYTQLSVLGADDGGEVYLTYTWAATVLPPGARQPNFSINGTNSAKQAYVDLSAAGTYTFRVTISDGFKTATSSVNVEVVVTPPSIVNAPVASPNPVSGTTVQLSVLGDDLEVGEAGLTYSWAATSGAPGPVSFSQNGTNAAKNTTATFSQSGQYTLQVTVSNGRTSTTSSVGVSVNTGGEIDLLGASQDIGNPALAGSYSRSGGSYIVRGGGADIWGGSDQFHYVYRQVTGDAQIVARVASVQNTNPLAKAGLMFRETLAADSRHVNLALTSGNGVRFQPRVVSGGATTSYNSTGPAAPYWLKLVRTGNTFLGYQSPDGVNWTFVEDQTISGLPQTMYVGLSVTARDNTKLNTSTFDGVSITTGSTTLSGMMMSSAAASVTTSTSTLIDGNLSTYFQSADASGAWVGVDFGAARTVTAIRFAPRKGYQAKMVGGKFQASNTADFSGEVLDLLVIEKTPKNNKVTVQEVAAAKAYRYVRYVAPDGSFGNIAETAFIGF